MINQALFYYSIFEEVYIYGSRRYDMTTGTVNLSNQRVHKRLMDASASECKFTHVRVDSSSSRVPYSYYSYQLMYQIRSSRRNEHLRGSNKISFHEEKKKGRSRSQKQRTRHLVTEESVLKIRCISIVNRTDLLSMRIPRYFEVQCYEFLP